MQRALRPSVLVPRGFDVESAFCSGATTVITVHPTSRTSLCPGCGTSSERIHSRYQRRLTDLPLAGRQVRLVVVARCFRCVTALCGRRIFTERFDDGALAPWARRTTRLDLIVHHLGLALGGRCDLERRRPITLLPDREPATAQAWLAGQPQIAVVARDRGGGYALAAVKALPHATQVADHWHLMENASHAFLDAVRRSMRQVRIAVGSATINPSLLTAAERIQYEGYLRREDTNAAILKQAETGISIKEIVRLTAHSQGLIRRYCEVSDPTCSGSARARSSTTCRGSTFSGLLAIVMAPTFGVASRRRDLEARCGSLPNGRHAVDVPKCPMLRACSAYRPRERSPA